MKEELKKPSYNAVIIAEYRLLNAIIKNKENYNDSRVSKNLFIDETAKSVFEAIEKLYKEKIDITPASLLQAGSNIDYNVTQNVIQTIFNIDDNTNGSIEDILETLNTAVIKHELINRIDFLKNELSKPGAIDTDAIRQQLYTSEDLVTNSDITKSTLLNYNEWTNEYIEDLKLRKLGRKYSFGDMLLDETFPRGASPGAITILTASTSMGKSTYMLHIMIGLLNLNIPSFLLSLEMGSMDLYDRVVANRCGINMSELYNPESIDGVIDAVNEQRDTLKENKNFYFCEAVNVDMTKLQALIREFKQKTHSDYAVIGIDLLSSMKGFMVGASGNTASSIENSLNALEALAKEENVHIIGVVQIRRDSDSLRVHSVEEIENLRPRLTDLKNSSAYGEKATNCLSVFRKKYYCDRYLKDSDPGVSSIEDIMEVQVLKDRNGGSSGKILKYMFDGEHFKLLPLIEEEQEKTSQQKAIDKLSELNIDF